MDKQNLVLFGIIFVLLIASFYFNFAEIDKTKTEITSMNEKISDTNTRISTVVSNWVRAKGDEASCNQICQKQNLECVFGQLATSGKSDDNKIIDCAEDYSKADWLKPYTLNCICRQK